MRVLNNGTKVCISCRNILSTNDFGSDRAQSDGLTTKCKICRNFAKRRLQKIPKWFFRTNINYPRRSSIKYDHALLDRLSSSGIDISILLPSGAYVDWKDLSD